MKVGFKKALILIFAEFIDLFTTVMIGGWEEGMGGGKAFHKRTKS